jgi:hypothetical protein
MVGLAGRARHSVAYDGGLEELGRSERLWTRLDRLAVTAAAEPLTSLRALLVLNAGFVVCFLALGIALFDDQAEFFRELMPGTILSFAEILFVAAVAWAIQLRTAEATGWRRYDTFWALSAGVFTVLAIDEITQATVFLSRWLEGLGLSASGGFRDLDAVLLVLLLTASSLLLLRRAGVLRHHLLAVGLLAIGAMLGVGSQALDSLVKSSSGEFALEESLKLAAEPFIVAGYLVVLRDVLRGRGDAL